MKKSLSAAAIFMLVAVSFSSAHAADADSKSPAQTEPAQQQMHHAQGAGHQPMGMMGGQMNGGMGMCKCMSAKSDTGSLNPAGATADR